MFRSHARCPQWPQRALLSLDDAWLVEGGHKAWKPDTVGHTDLKTDGVGVVLKTGDIMGISRIILIGIIWDV